MQLENVDYSSDDTDEENKGQSSKKPLLEQASMVTMVNLKDDGSEGSISSIRSISSRYVIKQI